MHSKGLRRSPENESEGALIDLPDPRTEQLPGSPLELVVCQLQLADPIEVSPEEVGLALRDGLSDTAGEYQLERFSPTRLFQVAIGDGPLEDVPPITPPEPGWRLTRGPWSVSAARDALTIETSAYTEWADLRGLLETALRVLDDVVSLKSEQRLGLRYVDRIERREIEHPSGWRRWIEPWALGAAADDHLGAAVTSFQQQVELDGGEGLRATLRSAIFADPARRARAICVLDTDSYRAGYRAFDREDVLAAGDRLRLLSLKLFQAAITEELYDEFARG